MLLPVWNASKNKSWLHVVHKRMLNLGFEGLRVTFEALTNLFNPHT